MFKMKVDGLMDLAESNESVRLFSLNQIAKMDDVLLKGKNFVI